MKLFVSKEFLVRYLIILVVCGSLGSCESNIQRKVESTNSYYDLSALLDRQCFLLDSLDPLVKKVTVIDGEKAIQSFRLDSAEWAEELEIFYKMDLNDPAFRNAYTQTHETKEDGLEGIIYEAREDFKTNIEKLSIWYIDDKTSPKYVTAIFKEKNALYDSRRFLKLSFNDTGEASLLSGYSIEGRQKMLLKDTIYYSVEAANSF